MNTPGASVVIDQSVTVQGTTNIIDVASATFTNNGTLGNVNITDATGTRFINNKTIGNVTVDAAGAITLGGNIPNLTVSKKADLEVVSGAQIGNLIVNTANTTINNKGTITNLKANAAVVVTGATPEAITGAGNVSGDAVPTAPANGLTELSVEGLLASDVKYLAFNLMNDAGTAQKIATLDDVKTFMFDQYEVNFNTGAIKVEDGKISITGSLLSTADWNKVKANGNKAEPYKITVLNKDKSAKIAKIAIYQDGKAVIEPISPATN